MSSLAAYLVSSGHQVSGSDLRESPALSRLSDLGVRVSIGHRPENLGGCEAVCWSSAVPPANPERRAAAESGLELLSRSDLLGAITATKSTIAVAGTHGKTTTSSMIALALMAAGLNPSAIIGGELNEIGSGTIVGPGRWLVVEADESDRTFLGLSVAVGVITNVEPDHLQTYGGSFVELQDCFATFSARATQLCLCGADDEVAGALAHARNLPTFGFSSSSSYRIEGYVGRRSSCSFSVRMPGGDRIAIDLPAPGRHNALDATAALAVSCEVGADPEFAAAGLRRYGGVARRFQFQAWRNGVAFVDDYAHLPSEVRAVLSAARDGDWGRVVCVFQPHRYSRTMALAEELGRSLAGADLLAVTDIYPAGEAPVPGISGRLVADAARAAGRDVEYLPSRAELTAWLEGVLRPGDICLLVGAGDLVGISEEVWGD
jgi:UDP-N-acetylmuramate--alanine ligase